MFCVGVDMGVCFKNDVYLIIYIFIYLSLSLFDFIIIVFCVYVLKMAVYYMYCV